MEARVDDVLERLGLEFGDRLTLRLRLPIEPIDEDVVLDRVLEGRAVEKPLGYLEIVRAERLHDRRLRGRNHHGVRLEDGVQSSEVVVDISLPYSGFRVGF